MAATGRVAVSVSVRKGVGIDRSADGTLMPQPSRRCHAELRSRCSHRQAAGANVGTSFACMHVASARTPFIATECSRTSLRCAASKQGPRDPLDMQPDRPAVARLGRSKSVQISGRCPLKRSLLTHALTPGCRLPREVPCASESFSMFDSRCASS
jgi:hypothetical protein